MSEQPKKIENIEANLASEWDNLTEDTPVVAAERLDTTSQNKFGQTVEGLVGDIVQSEGKTGEHTVDKPLLYKAKDGGTVSEQQHISNETVYQNRGSAPDESAPLGSRENPVIVEYPGGTMNTANKAASTKIGGPKQG